MAFGGASIPSALQRVELAQLDAAVTFDEDLFLKLQTQRGFHVCFLVMAFSALEHCLGPKAASMTKAMAPVSEKPPAVTHKKPGDLQVMEVPLSDITCQNVLLKQDSLCY